MENVKRLIRRLISEVENAAPTPAAAGTPPVTPAKPAIGKDKANVTGSLDVKKIAATLNVDPAKLTAAVAAAKTGQRNPAHNAVLADVFVHLMTADAAATTNVMNALKKVTAKE